MLKLFNRKSKENLADQTPQLTAWQQKAHEYAGFTSGGLTYDTYDDMQTDPMVQTALLLKKLAVMDSDWEIEPADDSAEAAAQADFARTVFEQLEGSPLGIIHNALDALAKGWSVQELVYAPRDGMIWLRSVKPKDPAFFGLILDEFGSVTGLRLDLTGEKPLELDVAKFVIFANRRGYGQPRGVSDLDAAHGHWSAKNKLMAAWKLHLEKFAMPTVLGRYERGLPADEQTAILKALQDVQNSTAIVYPNEIDISTLATQRDQSTAFLDAIDFHNREIARTILGQTLTTNDSARMGSLALGKVHLQMMMLQINALRQELADVVVTDQVLRPLVGLNFSEPRLPRFVLSPAPADLFRRFD
jgi:phage gp29-like protein